MNIEYRVLKHWNLANYRPMLNEVAILVKHKASVTLSLSACSIP